MRRVVLVECRHLQVFDIEGDAVAECQHQDDRAEDGKGEPDRIAQKLDSLAPGISPQPSQIEPLWCARFRLGRRRAGAAPRLLRAVDPGRVREITDESVFKRIAAPLLDEIKRRADRQHLAGMHQRDASHRSASFMK